MKSKQLLNGIKLIAFDMDGTLYTSEGILVPSYYKGIEIFNKKHNTNLRKPTIEELEHQIGQPVKIIFQNLFPELKNDIKKLIELSEIVLEEFLLLIENKGGRIFDNVFETLNVLKNKGYLLAVASNGREAYLSEIINAFDIKNFFLPLITINDTTIIKKSDILKTYMHNYSVTANELIMVGDRTSDLEAAREIGCYFIGCDYGFASHEVDNADTVISNIKELLDIL